MKPRSRFVLGRIAACLLVVIAAPLSGLVVAWLDSRSWLWCPAKAHGWIAGEHFCGSFLAMFTYHAVAGFLVFLAVWAVSMRLGRNRFGRWLSLSPLAWIAFVAWGQFKEASDTVCPESADKLEFFGVWDKHLAWMGALVLAAVAFLLFHQARNRLRA